MSAPATPTRAVWSPTSPTPCIWPITRSACITTAQTRTAGICSRPPPVDWGMTWQPDPGYRLRSQPREKWISDPFVLPLEAGG